MATPDPAHKGVIKVDLTTVPTTLLKGVNTVSFGQERTSLDVTDFTLDDKKFILGLKSGTSTLSGFKDAADAGQAILDAAYLSGADVFVRFLFDGTAGFEVVVKVSNIDIAPAIDDIVPVSYTLITTVSAAGNSVTVV